MLHCENISEVYTKRNMFLWLLSAFKAGFLNSVGFLLTGKFVSHVTGFGTQVGLALGHDEIFFGAELLIIPLSFIAGGIITSYILDGRKEKIPAYHLVQGLISFLIAAVIIMGELNLFNGFMAFDADENYNFIEFSVIAILCLICGLKNSLVTWSTYGKIRVTHLTGLSTDIGLNFLKMLSPKFQSDRFKDSSLVNWHRICTLLSFSLGALISAMAYPRLGHKALFIVFLLSLFMTVVSFIDRKSKLESNLETQAS